MKKAFFAVLPLWGMYVVGTVLFGLISLNRFTTTTDQAYPWIDKTATHVEQSWDTSSMFYRWDSGWYISIVRSGYHLLPDNTLSNIVFFPLYPLLVKLVSCLTISDFLAGWLVSILSLLGALMVLHKYISHRHPETVPNLAITLLLCFPTAIFFSAIYTESLFLFLLVASTYFVIVKSDLLKGGIMAFLAALTRVSGFLLAPVLLLATLQQSRFKLKFSYLWLLLPVLGLLSFFAFHYFTFGDFLLFFKVQSSWGRHVTIFSASKALGLLVIPAILSWISVTQPKTRSLSYMLILVAYVCEVLWVNRLPALPHAAQVNNALDLFFLNLAAITIGYWISKKAYDYAFLVFSTCFLAISGGTFMSINRYVLPLFPIQLMLAQLKGNYLKAWIFLSLCLWMLYTNLFVHFQWAG